MLDLGNLAEQREKVSEDKADLFDFYHENWSKVINELNKLLIENAALKELPLAPRAD